MQYRIKLCTDEAACIAAINKEVTHHEEADRERQTHRRVPNGTHGGVRGRRLVTAFYLI